MTITTLKQEAYMMKDGEIITAPLLGSVQSTFSSEKSYKTYNFNGSTLIFYDEDRNAFLIPIPGETLMYVEKLLHSAGYLRHFSLEVPMSNGIDYPELQDKWEAVKGRIKLLFAE